MSSLLLNIRGAITTDPTNIKRITKKDYEQLYAHTFGNLDEMEQFLETHNLPEHTQREIQCELTYSY